MSHALSVPVMRTAMTLVSAQDGQQLPEFPRIQDLSDLSDGIGLAALVSYYCPQELAWGDIAVADPPSMADSLYNIGLVIKFCHEALPYNPCLLTREDVVYMHRYLNSTRSHLCALLLLIIMMTHCTGYFYTKCSFGNEVRFLPPKQ